MKLQDDSLGILFGIPALVTKITAAISTVKPVTEFLDKAKNTLKSLGLDADAISNKISEIFGKRRPRYSDSELLQIFNNIATKRVFRNSSDSEIKTYWEVTMFGYQGPEVYDRDLRNTKEFETKNWEFLNKLFYSILGRYPTDTPATNWWYNIIKNNEHDWNWVAQAIADSDEAKHRKQTGEVLPAALTVSALLFVSSL